MSTKTEESIRAARLQRKCRSQKEAGASSTLGSTGGCGKFVRRGALKVSESGYGTAEKYYK